MGKERQRGDGRHQNRPPETNNYAEPQQQQQEHEQMGATLLTKVRYSPRRGNGRDGQNDQHHHYSIPTHRYVERQLVGSGRAAASPDAANGSAGRNSSAKRKLVSANDSHSLAFNHDYDYDYDHDDTPKGPLHAAENDATTNTLEVPAPQYGNGHGTSKSSPKRMRSNEWLLKSREVNVSPSQIPGSGKKDSANSRLRSRRRQSQGKSQNGFRSVSASTTESAAAIAEGERRSRFLEGSMNDRVSEKPPSIYTGQDVDEAIDRYMTGDDDESTGGSVSTSGSRPVYGYSYTSSAATTTSMSSVATDTTSAKQSGLLRFGQAIASAFNPFGVWNNVSEIWNGPQDVTKASTPSAAAGPKTHKEILAERQVQAEKAYAELKAAGYQGTVKSTSESYRGHPGQEKSSVKKSKHPFFVPRTPQQQHKHKPVRSISSTFSKDNLLSPSKSAIRASFQDLRKAASSINLPLTPKRGDSIDKENNGIIINDGGEDGSSKHVRNQVSRRHLEKQRKLRKKVSNLESQLERAKRQLSMVSGELVDVGDESKNGSASASGRSSANGRSSMNVTEDDEELDSAPPIPPPHREGIKVGQRKKFVPGALPSLPSERICLGQMEDKPTNRTLFTGATPLGPRALNAAEDKNTSTSPHRLRKTRKEERIVAPATNSRRTSNSTTLASDTQGEEQCDNGAGSYPDDEEKAGEEGGEEHAKPLVSSSVSKWNPATRKHRLQKPSPSAPFPSTSNIENTLSALPISARYNSSNQPSPNAANTKPKTPRRRRSSTTFPTKNPSPTPTRTYNSNNTTTTNTGTPTSTQRTTNSTTKSHHHSQSRRSGNGPRHDHNQNDTDAVDAANANAHAAAEDDDIPP
ncbi:hypothetical protein ACJ73_09168, partial [Blastomyces percursus]